MDITSIEFFRDTFFLAQVQGNRAPDGHMRTQPDKITTVSQDRHYTKIHKTLIRFI